MKKPKIFTAKFTENLARYAVYFVLVIVTPLLAKPMALLFNWVSYGQLRGFFTELFTAIFWLLEFAALIGTENALKKKFAAKTVAAEETVASTEGSEETAAPEAAEAAEAVETAEAPKKKKRKKKTKEKKPPAPPLPLKYVGILTAIVAACILLISAQIGFEVKPFYDIGEKVTGYELLEKIGVIVKNMVKCVWVLLFLKASLAMAEEGLKTYGKAEKKWLVWLIAGALLMLFGVYDVFVSRNPFWWTYLLFYVAFTAVYYFTEQGDVKSYLLIMFIYIF